MGGSETSLWKVSLLAVTSFVGVIFACRCVYNAFQESVSATYEYLRVKRLNVLFCPSFSADV